MAMIGRSTALALSLLAVAGCVGGSQDTQDEPAAIDRTSGALDTAPAVSAATELGSTTATAEAVAAQGAESSEAAVSEWFDGLAASDLSRMWSTIDPELKSGVRRSAWDACIAVQFPEQPDVSIEYEEAELYTKNGSVLSTGSATVDGDFQTVSVPVTFEVVERASGWYTIGQLTAEDFESCLTRSEG